MVFGRTSRSECTRFLILHPTGPRIVEFCIEILLPRSCQLLGGGVRFNRAPVDLDTGDLDWQFPPLGTRLLGVPLPRGAPSCSPFNVPRASRISFRFQLRGGTDRTGEHHATGIAVTIHSGPPGSSLRAGRRSLQWLPYKIRRCHYRLTGMEMARRSGSTLAASHS